MFVLSRTRPVQGFGHDYPADRAWQALYGHHAYNSFPRHVRSVDVGVASTGSRRSTATSIRGICSSARAPTSPSSIGERGEPADDVSALTLNYLFFGLRRSRWPGEPVAEPFLTLFRRFLDTYLVESKDDEILDVLPPFFAFRALVISHPRWYPSLSPGVRAALIRFAHRMMAARRFEGDAVQAMFRETR